MISFTALHPPCVLPINAFRISTNHVLKGLPWRPASDRLVLSLEGGREGRSAARAIFQSPVDGRRNSRGGHPLGKRVMR